MQEAENKQLTSIYATAGDQSLANSIKQLSDNDDRLASLQTSFPTYLDGYKTNLINVNDSSQAPQIIANAATLFRFQFEVLEILSRNTNLNDADKQKVINSLFGEGSQYKKLYNEYYALDGLVERAQKHFKDIKIKPLFDSVVPQALKAENQVRIDDLANTFKEIENVKKTMGVNENSHSVKLMTTHLDKGNTEAAILGLVMSNPKQLGTLFAMIGNKDKEGEIDIIQDKKRHIGGKSVKGVAHSALRCLLVISILCAFVAAGYFGAPVLAGFIGMAEATTAISSGIGAVVGTAIGVTAITQIDKKASEETRYTYDYQHGSVNTDFCKIGVASDNVIKYVMGPIYKGRLEDKRKAMTDFEKRINNITTNIFANRQAINLAYSNQSREDLDKISKNLDNLFQTFGINYSKDGAIKTK